LRSTSRGVINNSLPIDRIGDKSNGNGKCKYEQIYNYMNYRTLIYWDENGVKKKIIFFRNTYKKSKPPALLMRNF